MQSSRQLFAVFAALIALGTGACVIAPYPYGTSEGGRRGDGDQKDRHEDRHYGGHSLADVERR